MAKKETRTAKKVARKPPPGTKKLPARRRPKPSVPPVAPDLEAQHEVAQLAAQSIQETVEATRRGLEVDLERFQQELQSIQTFVQGAVREMQMAQAGSLEYAMEELESTPAGNEGRDEESGR